MLDPEAESEAVKQRSAELAQLLDAGAPVVDRSGIREALAESRRLGDAANRARRDAAQRVAEGLDPGCPIGHAPPVRRVRTDPRTGRNLDPFGGRSVVTPELVAYWEHRKDVVFPAVEAMYRQAATERPYREALVAAASGQVALLRERRSMLSEGGVELEAAVMHYDEAFVALRQAANDAQSIATEAETRLASLKREAASALVGTDEVKNFIGATLGAVLDAPVDPDTAMPLIQVDRAGQPV
jgi:hypothetical protein